MQAELNAVVHLLVSGLQGGQGRGNEQQQILNQYAENPAFCRCLSYIFQCEQPPGAQCTMPPPLSWSHVREMAGLVLKNNIKRHDQILGRDVIQYAGVTASAALMSHEIKIRKAAAQVIAAVTRTCGLEAWTQSQPPIDLIDEIWQMASHGNNIAFVALRYLFEDASDKLGEHTGNIITLLCEASMSSFEALECIIAAYEMGAELNWPESPQQFSAFQQGLWQRSENVARMVTSMLPSESPPIVRRGLLKLQTLLLDYRFAFELPSSVAENWMQCAIYHIRNPLYFAETAAYISMVGSFATNLEDLSQIQEDTLLMSLKPQHAQELLPILLGRMAYSEDEVSEIMEKDNISIRDIDILPPSMSRRGSSKKEGQDVDDEEVDQMTMRSEAARCLDAISLVHPGGVYSELRSILQARVSDSDWKIRETAIMAIGCIMHGCYKAMKSDLSKIMSIVLDRAQGDGDVLVRSIACWTLGKAMPYFAMDGQNYLQRVFEVLVECCHATSKRLQWTAITSLHCAFAICSQYNASLVDAVPLVMRSMGEIAERFQTNNLLHLLNLFDSIVAKWPDSTKLEGSRAFLQILFARIDAARSDLLVNPRSVAVREMLYILSPIANLFQSKLQLDPNARHQLIQNCSVCIKFYYSNPDEDSDFVTYPLHLLAVMFEVFPGDKECLPYDVHVQTLKSVLQPGGDYNILLEALLYMAALSFQPPQPFAEDFMQTYGPFLMRLCNDVEVTCDAIWCMGQCCINMKSLIPQNPIIAFVGSLIERVLRTQPDDFVRHILETCAQTATRCVFYIPDLLRSLPHAGSALGPLSSMLHPLPNDTHKAEAARGIFLIVRHSSLEVLQPAFWPLSLLALSFHDSIGRFPELKQTVSECFRELLSSRVGRAFEAELRKGNTREMQEMYNL